METTSRRYAVLSDLHFGTPESSVNDSRYLSPLIAHLVSRAPWTEVVLTGDLLDINLSTLTHALEGTSPTGRAPLVGFRQFVERLDAGMRQAGKGGLAELAGAWIYTPGNHDYLIWNSLATKVVCEDVIARGDRMGPMPLTTYTWTGAASFFSGVFSAFGVRDRVIVEYPNHEIPVDGQGTILLTHGHYLDPSQTRGNDLHDNLRDVVDPGELRDIVARIFIETAQYQALANAVSYTESTIRIADELFGPDGLENKLQKVWARFSSGLLHLLVHRRGALRGVSISRRMLANVDAYVEKFCQCSPRPRWFVFGHTHRQGVGKSPSGIEVFNVGSGYPDRDMAITFIEIELGPSSAPDIRLLCVDSSGSIRRGAGS